MEKLQSPGNKQNKNVSGCLSVKNTGNNASLKKKLLQCYLETENDWNSFNRIANALLSEANLDVDTLTIVAKGYKKQGDSKQGSIKKIETLITEINPTNELDYVKLFEYFILYQKQDQAMSVLEKGIGLYPYSVDLIYTYIENAIEQNKFDRIFKVLTEDKLTVFEDININLIYIKAYITVHSSLRNTEVKKLNQILEQSQQIDPLNIDIYELKLVLLEKVQFSESMVKDFFYEIESNQIRSTQFLKKLLIYSLHNNVVTTSKEILIILEEETEELWDSMVLSFVSLLITSLKDVGYAEKILVTSMDRKNKVFEKYYLELIQIAEQTLYKLERIIVSKENKEKILISINNFVIEAYQQLAKLKPNETSIQIEKIKFLKKTNEKKAEIELKSQLIQNKNDLLSFEMAELLFYQGRYDEAIMYYEKINTFSVGWKIANEVRINKLRALLKIGLEESVYYNIEEYIEKPIQPSELIFCYAEHYFKKAIFNLNRLDFKKANEYLSQMNKNCLQNKKGVLLQSSLFKNQNQIPKAISILDKVEEKDDVVVNFRRACLLFEMFKETGHKKYLEDAEIEINQIEFPEFIDSDALMLLPDSIIQPESIIESVKVTNTLNVNETDKSFGKIPYWVNDYGLKWGFLQIKKQQGNGNLIHTLSSPYSLEKEWELVKKWAVQTDPRISQMLETNDMLVSSDDSLCLVFEPSLIRAQLYFAVMSEFKNTNLSNVAFAFEKTDVNGNFMYSRKISFLIESLLNKNTFNTIAIPMANMSDTIEYCLMNNVHNKSFIAAQSVFRLSGFGF
ncbi:MAG: tetratricopeptide repeat protein [Caldisericia bacterium]|nr:tetratricopeptide repeat protein [Caldisericia bacterium]